MNFCNNQARPMMHYQLSYLVVTQHTLDCCEKIYMFCFSDTLRSTSVVMLFSEVQKFM